MITDKANMLCILKILQEYSDEAHIITMGDLRTKLETQYGIKPDRRTIYSAMDMLIEMGYDISKYEDNGEGYYLRERVFDPAELRLLLDAVYNCSYISGKQTEELLGKIRSFASVYDRKKYNYTNIVSTDKKSPNAEVFLNIEILDQAINEKKQIAFTYLKYDENKKLVARRDEKYVANPYAMLCENEKYYLILLLDGRTQPAFYRIDMMKNIEILDKPITVSSRAANLDSTKKVVYAYSGEPVQVKLLCDEVGLRYCIEKFGKDIIITPKKSKYEILVNAPCEGMIFWALQYIQHVEVVAPQSLRKDIIKTMKKSAYFGG